MTYMYDCPNCWGSGEEEEDSGVECQDCAGTGALCDECHEPPNECNCD